MLEIVVFICNESPCNAEMRGQDAYAHVRWNGVALKSEIDLKQALGCGIESRLEEEHNGLSVDWVESGVARCNNGWNKLYKW